MSEYAIPPDDAIETAAFEASILRSRALALYMPPFRYEMGYIWDAAGNMVADDDGTHIIPSDPKETQGCVRIRGWGRIGYMQDASALQDKVGELIAEALTKFWTAEAKEVPATSRS